MSNVSSSDDDSQEEIDFTKDREVDPQATYDRRKPLAEKTLDHVFDDGASSNDKKDDSVKFTIYNPPSSLLRMLSWIAKENKISRSMVQRLSTKLGITRMNKDPRLEDLLAQVERNEELFRNNADLLAEQKLDFEMKPRFLRRDDRRVTFRVFWWVGGALNDLSNDTGFSLSYLTVIACLHALLTYPTLNAYRSRVIDELDNYYRTIKYRTDQLSSP